MKKSILIALFAFLALNTNVLLASNTNEPVATQTPANENKLSETEVQKLVNRYTEISNMDKSNLSNSEKRELKKESSQIQKELKADGTVVYISSAAALILIIILLIILL